MSSMDEAWVLARPSSWFATVTRLLTAPRFLVYSCCTLLALLTSYHLGKDMAWDTLDYHFYAGFSALHDRFGQDYFPGGPQSYLNPYVFVPFYVLAASGLTALQVVLILAAVQSVILWLVYELALAVAPPTTPTARLTLGICAAALAYANPVLIVQFGSSYADILTADIVVAGWLSLVGAIRAPNAMRVAYAALLLGCASALKLTNALHAVSAGVMVLFIPGSWRNKLRCAALFAVAGIVGFAVVAAPWSIRLEEQFGNPFFPMLNGLFQSPQLTTARLIAYRFIPATLGAALWRPFAMVTPRALIHTELAAPDLRYALLPVAAAFSLLAWGWKRRRRANAAPFNGEARDGSGRPLAALGSAFVVDWILWLTASGNSRYFIPMACIAAVIAVALLFRACSEWPKLLSYLLITVFVVQFFQLRYGTQYPSDLPWDHKPWFEVSVPKSLASEPELYLSIGMQSNSFIAPYLASGSGFINLEGDYTLGPDGANGKHIEALITRYSPHLRMLMRDLRRDADYDSGLPSMVNANDALQPFGLQLDASHCTRIVVRGVSSPDIGITSRAPSTLSSAKANVGYFITCHVVTEKARDPALVAAESEANLVLDRLEDACPALLQPRRPASYLLGDKAHGYIWARQYPNTDMYAWVDHGWVEFQAYMSQEGYAGPESAWQKAPLRVNCGRGASGYFLRVTMPR